MSERLDDDVLVCRCEEVTAGDIRWKRSRAGATDVTQVKLRTRAGMGLCQGRTCKLLVQQILSQELGVREGDGVFHPPGRLSPMTFGTLGGDGFDD